MWLSDKEVWTPVVGLKPFDDIAKSLTLVSLWLLRGTSSAVQGLQHRPHHPRPQQQRDGAAHRAVHRPALRWERFQAFRRVGVSFPARESPAACCACSEGRQSERRCFSEADPIIRRRRWSTHRLLLFWVRFICLWAALTFTRLNWPNSTCQTNKESIANF